MGRMGKERGERVSINERASSVAFQLFLNWFLTMEPLRKIVPTPLLPSLQPPTHPQI